MEISYVFYYEVEVNDGTLRGGFLRAGSYGEAMSLVEEFYGSDLAAVIFKKGYKKHER